MAKEIKQGNASVTLDQDMTAFFTDVLKKVAPSAEKIMTEAFEQIERDAKKDWPKRPPTRRFNRETNKVFFQDESQNSWNKFKRGVRIEPDGSLVVFLKNTAPYAWAIKFGVDSKNAQGKPILQTQGKRAANELLVKPLRKHTRKIVKALTKELFGG